MNKYLATLKCHWIPIRKSSLSALLWDEAFVNGIPPLQNKLDKKINDLSKIQASWESSQIVYFFLSVPFPCFFFKKQKLTKPNQRKQDTQSWCRTKHMLSQVTISGYMHMPKLDEYFHWKEWMAVLLICRVNNVSCKPEKYSVAGFEGLYESEHNLKVIISPSFLGADLFLQIRRFYLIVVSSVLCRK